jgi:hydrogenase/urease accessory protein HupE
MRLSTILPVVGSAVMVLAVFALIATWAVSETTPIDSTFWIYPAGFLVAGVLVIAVGRRINR